MTDVKLWLILPYLKPFNCVQKMSSASFKNIINKMWLQIIHIYTYTGVGIKSSIMVDMP